MSQYPLTLDEITSWCRSRKRSLQESPIVLDSITERTEYLPAVAIDFSGPTAVGRINGWVSGAFDFQVIRVSDGENLYFGHVDVSRMEELEPAYQEFLNHLA